MIALFKKYSRDIRFRAAVLLAAFIACYWVPLKTLASIWMNNEDYSSGFLIPIASLYLLWDKRKQLGDAEIKSFWPALPLLLLFNLLCLYGTLGSSGNVSMPAIPFLIILYTAFCFGLPLVKKLFLPLGFLIFMIPVPPVVELSLGLFLKDISSKMGGWIIQTANIPVFVSGNIIDIGVMQLQVVDACNGMRYLFPLLALGVLYGYFFEKVLWKKIVCFLATIPIAILTNGLRIGITGILANSFGPGVADGFFHGFSGWAIFIVAFAFLFLIGRLLRLLPPRPGLPSAASRPSRAFQSGLPPVGKGTKASFCTACALMVIFGLLALSTYALPPVKLQGGIASFPLKISNWEGHIVHIDPALIERSGAEESFSGIYKNENEESISLYIGYRSTAFLSNENFFHSPTVCLPSSGWVTQSLSARTITDVPQFGQLKVSTMVIENAGARQLVYFWFQTKDKATSNKDINRFHLAMHAIQRDNTYDFFIRPITPVRPDETIEDARRRMDCFVRDMMKVLLQFTQEHQIPPIVKR